MATKQAQIVMENESDWNYCDRCDRTHATNWKCTICDEVLCDDCKILHMRARRTKTHRLISYEERNQEVNSKSNFYCKIHPINRIILCCDTCQIPVCEECTESGHDTHKFVKISTFADQKRCALIQEARSNVKSLKEKQLKEAFDNLNKVNKKFHTKTLNVSKDYDDVTERFISSFKEVSKNLQNDVAYKKDQACTVINERKQALEDKINAIQTDLSKYEETLAVNDYYVAQHSNESSAKFKAEIPQELRIMPEIEDINDNIDAKILESFLQKCKTLTSSKAMSRSDVLMVAAIVLNSSTSGYAFSMKNDYETDRFKISTTDPLNISPYTMTALLLKPNKTFHSYGDEAAAYYSDLVNKGSQADWYFFKYFPIQLCGETVLQPNFKLKDISGRTIPALTIYEMTIRYFKDRLYKNIQKCSSLINGRIAWVITVPSAMKDEGKKLVEDAAQQAGINGDVLIVEESETASIYCRELPIDALGGNDLSFMAFLPGSKQLILHLECDVSSLTLLQVSKNSQCKRIYTKMFTEGITGSSVYKKIQTLVIELFGNKHVDTFREKHSSEYSEMMQEIKTKIRITKYDTIKKVAINISPVLYEIANKTKEDLGKRSRYLYSESIQFGQTKLNIKDDIFKSFFDDLVTCIVAESEKIIKKEGIKFILMDGEFAESPILQRKLRCAFPNLTVLVPPDPKLAVLNGTVLHGHNFTRSKAN